MLANNNHGIITKLAKHSLKRNKPKWAIMITAVTLSAFLLFCILTVGSTYFNMKHMQNVRMNGADYDAILVNGFTDQQQESCEKNKEIATVGVSAYSGYAVRTDEDDTLHTGLIWCDETYWKEQMGPAREWVKGSYPRQENELMVTRAALADCGKGDLEVGDSFTLTYGDKQGSHTKTFRISGMWGGYGETKMFYVSKAFYDKTGYQLEDEGGLYLKFKNFILTRKTQEELENSLNLNKRQALLITGEKDKSLGILAGLAGLVLFTCLSAYLLIYNILYLSVSGNIRYYGLLQTVGMTGKQVYRLLQRQMLFIGSLGAALGLLLGTATSFVLIPYIVRTLGIREKTIEISFHPGIFLLSVLVVGGTVYLGSSKPARIATNISPMEALGYHVVASERISHKTGKGSLLWRMAREQVKKDKKKSWMVVLSLASSLSVFLCLVTLIGSHGARTIMSNYMDTDLIIRNDTLIRDHEGGWSQIMDDTFLDSIREDKRVKSVYPLSGTKVIIPWEPEFIDMWLREFCDIWLDYSYQEMAEAYKQHPDDFYGVMLGIGKEEFEYLNSSLEDPVDSNLFLKGETCIVFQGGLPLDRDKLKGKDIWFSMYTDRKREYGMKIGGMTGDAYYGAIAGKGPVILVSEDFVKGEVKDPFIFKANVRYEKEYDEKAEEDILAAMDGSPYAKDFSYESKIEDMRGIKKAQGNMMGVGVGISLILALVGIMNYINTVIGTMQSRQVSLSILESVGMTGKQVKGMLIREGLLYAGGSLLITGTVGLGITFICYTSMNYMGIAFRVPVGPMMVVTGVVVVVCVMIPLVTYGRAGGAAFNTSLK